MAFSSDVTVKVEGLRELRRALREAPAETRRLVRKANRDAAEVVAPEARARAPRRSGRLAGSVSASGDNLGGYVKAGTGVRVPYAGPIHFGWPERRIRPQPFLFSALGSKRDEVVEAYEAALEGLARTLDFD